VFGSSEFAVKPRKGQFVVFDMAVSKLINSIINDILKSGCCDVAIVTVDSEKRR